MPNTCCRCGKPAPETLELESEFYCSDCWNELPDRLSQARKVGDEAIAALDKFIESLPPNPFIAPKPRKVLS